MINDQPPTPDPFTPLISSSPAPRISRFAWMRHSLTFRAIVVGILALLLLIPLGMVHDLIQERSYRKQEAEEGISRDWGREQTITGPVIDVPYEVPVRVPVGDGSGRMEDRVEIHHAQYLPEALNAEVVLEPYKKHRGIYDVAVYGSRTRLTGSFAPVTDARLSIGHRMRWNDAKLVLGISDLRSIKEQVSMVIGGHTVQFEPGLPSNDVANNGLSVPFPLDSLLGLPINFDAKLTINAVAATT